MHLKTDTLRNELSVLADSLVTKDGGRGKRKKHDLGVKMVTGNEKVCLESWQNARE